MILVCGPACGGKTTYVEQHKAAGQRVVDYDSIVEGITGQRYEATEAERQEARWIWMGQLPGADWVIWANPTRQQRAMMRQTYGAEVVVVMADKATCIERAKAQRPAAWVTKVSDWFASWQPSTSVPEQVVTTC